MYVWYVSTYRMYVCMYACMHQLTHSATKRCSDCLPPYYVVRSAHRERLPLLTIHSEHHTLRLFRTSVPHTQIMSTFFAFFGAKMENVRDFGTKAVTSRRLNTLLPYFIGGWNNDKVAALVYSLVANLPYRVTVPLPRLSVSELFERSCDHIAELGVLGHSPVQPIQQPPDISNDIHLNQQC